MTISQQPDEADDEARRPYQGPYVQPGDLVGVDIDGTIFIERYLP